MKHIISSLLFYVSFSFQLPVYGDLYWISPNGSASWQAAKGTEPINGTGCSSLKTANSTAKSGDTIIMRGGSYNTPINPSNSGTGGNGRIVYKAYTGETPVISGTDQNKAFEAITIDNKRYIKIEGITVKDDDRWMNIRNGSSYIEIAKCTFTEPDSTSLVPITIWGQCSGGALYTCPVSNIWFHHNTVYNYGRVGGVNIPGQEGCDDIGALMYVGSIALNDTGSQNNTIENNVFYHGGHHIIETYTKYNVIRNNFIHNEGWMESSGTCIYGPSARNGKYGNRCIQIYDGRDRNGMYNLIEGNRLGNAGFASDGGMDGNMVITSPRNIIRYNYSYHSETFGIYFKVGGSSYGSHNRAYNNTCYYNGQNSRIYPNAWTGFGDMDWRYSLGFHPDKSCSSNVLINNILYKGYSGDIRCADSRNSYADNWVTKNADPLFADTNVSNPFNDTLPNLSLKWGSPCIDEGLPLTKAIGAGSNSLSLIVVDALYFQDGTWGSSLASMGADWIAIGTVSNTVQIKSIDYDSNKITLVSPVSWSDKAPVWLFKKSDGAVVLYGNAPDYGAHEYIKTSMSIKRAANISTIAKLSTALFKVYDMKGRLVADFTDRVRAMNAGSNPVRKLGQSLPGGAYVVRFTDNAVNYARKIVTTR